MNKLTASSMCKCGHSLMNHKISLCKHDQLTEDYVGTCLIHVSEWQSCKCKKFTLKKEKLCKERGRRLQ